MLCLFCCQCYDALTKFQDVIITTASFSPLVDMPKQQNTLAIFTRYPCPGATKTRLIPSLGPDGAAYLHRQMTERVLAQAEEFCSHSGTALEIHFDGGSLTAMGQWLGPYTFVKQKDGSLGERMESAFHQIFAAGTSKAVIIGTDCPRLTSGILRQAFTALDDYPIVLGPALDGGYYLIGLNAPCPALFEGIDWGTAAVLAQTLTRAQPLNVHQLPSLHDIDRPEDLVHLDHHPNPE